MNPGNAEFVSIRNVDIYEKLIQIEREQAELKSEFKIEQRSLKTMFSVLAFIVMPVFSAVIGLIFT